MSNTDSNDGHLQEINEEIYKRNLELAIVNKTLSLLRKLYQISLLTLDPPSLSEKISETVRVDLNMEAVGVMHFDDKTDTLTSFMFSKSERLKNIMNKLGFLFKDLQITEVSKKPILKQVFYEKAPAQPNNLDVIWGGTIPSIKLKTISDQSHIKTILLYPLVTQNRVIGALFLGLNRDYSVLNEHEKDSINSLVDVVAVALDKAFLYEQLREANEQLKILDQARAEFITIASHQLRTPPTTIKWYLASILANDFGQLPEEVKKQLQKTQLTNNSMISLIDDLLNVSRIERGKLEFNFEPIDLLAITQLTVDQLLPQAENKKIQLIFNQPETTLPQIIADKEKLRQVINNLIDNAIKYTKQGRVVVELSETDQDLIIKVTDTGKGVTVEQEKSIFEKFDRGKEKSKNSAGLGLGLYVAKIVIEQHNGKIWVESQGEGKGSTFAFSIPIKNNLENSTFDLTKTQKISN